MGATRIATGKAAQTGEMVERMVSARVMDEETGENEVRSTQESGSERRVQL